MSTSTTEKITQHSSSSQGLKLYQCTGTASGKPWSLDVRREKKQGYTTVFSVSSILQKGDERVCQNKNKGNEDVKKIIELFCF